MIRCPCRALPNPDLTHHNGLDVVRWVLVHLVLLYRATLGRLLGGQCRYHPTCSQYALDSIEKYGPWRGGWRALKRIGRCHPWGGKGYDPA
jgi:putative membrane protein insertion efficiency factor